MLHLTSDGTCKCGLRCPFQLEDQFSFDPLVLSLPDNGIPSVIQAACKVGHAFSSGQGTMSDSTSQSMEATSPLATAKQQRRRIKSSRSNRRRNSGKRIPGSENTLSVLSTKVVPTTNTQANSNKRPSMILDVKNNKTVNETLKSPKELASAMSEISVRGLLSRIPGSPSPSPSPQRGKHRITTDEKIPKTPPKVALRLLQQTQQKDNNKEGERRTPNLSAVLTGCSVNELSQRRSGSDGSKSGDCELTISIKLNEQTQNKKESEKTEETADKDGDGDGRVMKRLECLTNEPENEGIRLLESKSGSTSEIISGSISSSTMSTKSGQTGLEQVFQAPPSDNQQSSAHPQSSNNNTTSSSSSLQTHNNLSKSGPLPSSTNAVTLVSIVPSTQSTSLPSSLDNDVTPSSPSPKSPPDQLSITSNKTPDTTHHHIQQYSETRQTGIEPVILVHPVPPPHSDSTLATPPGNDSTSYESHSLPTQQSTHNMTSTQSKDDDSSGVVMMGVKTIISPIDQLLSDLCSNVEAVDGDTVHLPLSLLDTDSIPDNAHHHTDFTTSISAHSVVYNGSGSVADEVTEDVSEWFRNETAAVSTGLKLVRDNLAVRQNGCGLFDEGDMVNETMGGSVGLITSGAHIPYSTKLPITSENGIHSSSSSHQATLNLTHKSLTSIEQAPPTDTPTTIVKDLSKMQTALLKTQNVLSTIDEGSLSCIEDLSSPMVSAVSSVLGVSDSSSFQVSELSSLTPDSSLLCQSGDSFLTATSPLRNLSASLPLTSLLRQGRGRGQASQCGEVMIKECRVNLRPLGREWTPRKRHFSECDLPQTSELDQSHVIAEEGVEGVSENDRVASLHPKRLKFTCTEVTDALIDKQHDCEMADPFDNVSPIEQHETTIRPVLSNLEITHPDITTATPMDDVTELVSGENLEVEEEKGVNDYNEVSDLMPEAEAVVDILVDVEQDNNNDDCKQTNIDIIQPPQDKELIETETTQPKLKQDLPLTIVVSGENIETQPATTLVDSSPSKMTSISEAEVSTAQFEQEISDSGKEGSLGEREEEEVSKGKVGESEGEEMGNDFGWLHILAQVAIEASPRVDMDSNTNHSKHTRDEVTPEQLKTDDVVAKQPMICNDGPCDLSEAGGRQGSNIPHRTRHVCRPRRYTTSGSIKLPCTSTGTRGRKLRMWGRTIGGRKKTAGGGKGNISGSSNVVKLTGRTDASLVLSTEEKGVVDVMEVNETKKEESSVMIPELSCSEIMEGMGDESVMKVQEMTTSGVRKEAEGSEVKGDKNEEVSVADETREEAVQDVKDDAICCLTSQLHSEGCSSHCETVSLGNENTPHDKHTPSDNHRPLSSQSSSPAGSLLDHLTTTSHLTSHQMSSSNTGSGSSVTNEREVTTQVSDVEPGNGRMEPGPHTTGIEDEVDSSTNLSESTDQKMASSTVVASPRSSVIPTKHDSFQSHSEEATSLLPAGITTDSSDDASQSIISIPLDLVEVVHHHSLHCYSTSQFQPGDVVWAKAPQLPGWPGAVINHTQWRKNRLKEAPPGKVCLQQHKYTPSLSYPFMQHIPTHTHTHTIQRWVKWYGDDTVSLVSEKSMKPLSEGLKKRMTRKTTKGLQKAINLALKAQQKKEQQVC